MARSFLVLPVLYCVLLASGCAGRLAERSAAPQGWQDHHQRQASLDSWRLSARMAVQTTNQGGSADLYWQQSAGRYTIQINLPLGQGAMRLEGDAQQVTAKMANGEVVEGPPDELLRHFFDTSVPVSAMQDWLRGIATGNDYSSATWNENGQLYRLEQKGWRVEMSDYIKLGELQMPKRFYLEKRDDAEISIRLIVRDWRTQS